MKEIIIKQIFSIFGKENIKLISYFGNKNGRDIDVFVILKSDIEYNCLLINNFDITYLSLREANKIARNLDPLITEPILFGEIIYGNDHDIRQAIKNPDSREEIIKYLKEKSIIFLNWAKDHFRKNNLALACDCIRFSLSFYYYAKYYNKSREPISFKAINKIFVNEFRLIKKAELLSKGSQDLSVNQVINLLHKTEGILTSD